MAQHTKGSTAGSAHARYVAYREAGYSAEDARRMSRPITWCAECCGNRATITVAGVAYCDACGPADAPLVDVSFG